MNLTLSISKFILIAIIAIVLYRIVRQRSLMSQAAPFVPNINAFDRAKIMKDAAAKQRQKFQQQAPPASAIINIPDVGISDVIN